MNSRFFVGSHESSRVYKRSSSGGAFTALTDELLNEKSENISIYGCIIDDKLKITHIRTTDANGRDMMRGSKYVGSKMSGIFKQVMEDLNSGWSVLFSGTPCQIDGLNSLLKLSNVPVKNLVTVEVICHGVGSVTFFDDYIHYLEEKKNSSAVKCNFRAKSKPWKKQDMKVEFESGKNYISTSTKYDWFYSMYLSHYILRPACFRCIYTKEKRVADISMADHWGGEDSCKAESLIMVNTEKGMDIIDKITGIMKLKEINRMEVKASQLERPSKKPVQYDSFWNMYLSDGFNKVQEMYGYNNLKGKIQSLAVAVIDKFNLTTMIKKTMKAIK